MLFGAFLKLAILAALVSSVTAARKKQAESETIDVTTKQTAVRVAAAVVPTIAATVDGVSINTNTSTQVVALPAAISNATDAAATSLSVKSTVLIFARDSASAYSAFSGLNAYAIPYQVILVPQDGITLPTLNSSKTAGNFGAIVILSEVSYDYGGTEGFQSALTADQWAALYQYQVNFGVRMVRLDAFPSSDFGVTALGGCCDDDDEQLVYISNATAFPTAGLKTGIAAGVSTVGLWHYPAQITNSTIASEIAGFGNATGFVNPSTAAIVNDFSGRKQMVFFTGFATDWSSTSNFLQHAWIHWATRGLYTGYRRCTLNTQIDDMFLISDIYSPANSSYQVTPADLTQHVTWQATTAEDIATGTQCGIGSIEYPNQIDTPLEWVKPLGTGKQLWPSTPTKYPYTTACTNLDALKEWYNNKTNLNAFAHISHTFTHEDENNATYFDVSQEITWNQAWLTQVGIASATKFSSKGIIPPAITGLHNGDALRAWLDNGIVNVVGDNTRPVLMNQVNEMWPLISTVADNGYAGVQIDPRWATNIYYNCQLPACTVLEWINTSAGNGDWYDLLALEKATNTRHLLGLHHDAFMFHQANLNYLTAPKTTINGVSKQLSLFQAWMETVAQEMIRLVTWPIISQIHDDRATGFASRMARDACSPSLTYTINSAHTKITGVTVTTTGNTCAVTIPVTVPGTVTSLQGFTTEQIGSDPLTIWVKMSGSPVTFTLKNAIDI